MKPKTHRKLTFPLPNNPDLHRLRWSLEEVAEAVMGGGYFRGMLNQYGTLTPHPMYTFVDRFARSLATKNCAVFDTTLRKNR